ncbi:MAG: Glutamate-1-semialdehyde 2,1-aminomutase [Dehalococcoidia bacterium]|nr:Glutamate-1-semialdehyde 2,1-aminomutase [Bacillota bacterium]
MGRSYTRSQALFKEALEYIPGGVNSPVRAFRSVGDHPLFIDHGAGSRLVDVDGNEYIDYVGSWGPLILGHRHPQVVAALKKCVEETGTSFGAPTEIETEMARIITRAFPSIEMVRMVNSGTEATMSALRLARAYTNRDKILKFEGCYHGHSDSLLIKAGSGALTLGVPSSPGVPKDIAGGTLTASFNHLAGVEEIFSRMGEEIAAVILEPVTGNMGVVLPAPGFLEGLAELTARYGALLIFDEVMTGFRVAWGGVQTQKDIRPDLTCLGKIIGGGLPVGAYGGRREIMENIAPAGPVYQAGTLSGNPLAMSAGLAVLKELEKPGCYERLDQLTEILAQGLKAGAQKAGIPLRVNRYGSMLTGFFAAQEVKDYKAATSSDTLLFKEYFQLMLARGIYLAPSQFEAVFVSLAHSKEDIAQTVEASEQALHQLAARF